MSLFDLIINLIESGTMIYLINLIYKKKINYLFVVFLTISFLFVSITNYYDIYPEILFVGDAIIIYMYSYLMTNKLDMTNIVYALISVFLLDNVDSIVILLSRATPAIPFEIYIVLSKILYFCFIYGVSKTISNTIQYHPKYLLLVGLIIFCLSINFAMLNNSIFLNEQINPYIYSVLWVFIAIGILLLINGIRQEETIIYEDKLKINALEQASNTYNLVRNNQKEVSRIKHDQIHIYNSIEYAINNNELNHALEIINKQREHIQSVEKVIVTGNNLIDFIISKYMNEIRRGNIEVISSKFSNNIPMRGQDLFIVFGNLLENAIENCKPNPKRKILISAGIINEYYYICIKNTILESVLKSNPDFKSTKHNRSIHGYGIDNCRTIINKYQGDIVYSESEQYLEVKIIFLNDTID